MRLLLILVFCFSNLRSYSQCYQRPTIWTGAIGEEIVVDSIEMKFPGIENLKVDSIGTSNWEIWYLQYDSALVASLNSWNRSNCLRIDSALKATSTENDFFLVQKDFKFKVEAIFNEDLRVPRTSEYLDFTFYITKARKAGNPIIDFTGFKYYYTDFPMYR